MFKKTLLKTALLFLIIVPITFGCFSNAAAATAANVELSWSGEEINFKWNKETYSFEKMDLKKPPLGVSVPSDISRNFVPFQSKDKIPYQSYETYFSIMYDYVNENATLFILQKNNCRSGDNNCDPKSFHWAPFGSADNYKVTGTVPDGIIPKEDCSTGFLSFATNLLKGNGFDCAVKGSVVTLAGWMDESVELGAGLVNKSINSKNIATAPIKGAWIIVRDISLSLLAIGVLVIAFANVLSLDPQKWGAQKMIPKIVIAILLTYFSFFIAELLIDFANVLTAQAYSLLKSENGAVYGASGQFGITSDVLSNFGSVIILLVGAILVFVSLLYLAIVLLARIVVLNLLIVLAPIAFILGILPWTEKQASQWWTEFTKWVFMGPAIMFLLMVGGIILNAMQFDDQQNKADSIFVIFSAAVVYFIAAQLPVTMGNKAMGAFAGKVKGAMKWSGNKATFGRYDAAKGFFSQRSEKEKAIATRRAASWRASIGGGGGKVGRWTGGYQSDIEAQTAKKRLHDTQVNDRKKLYENVEEARLNQALYTKDPVDIEAAFAVLSNRGKVESKEFDDKGNKKENYEKHKELINKYGDESSPHYNPSIRGDIGKENLAAMISAGNEKLNNFAVQVLAKKKKIQDYSPGLVSAMEKDKEGAKILGGFTRKDIQTLFGSQGNQALRESFKGLADRNVLNAEAIDELTEQLKDSSNKPNTPNTGQGGSNPSGNTPPNNPPSTPGGGTTPTTPPSNFSGSDGAV